MVIRIETVSITCSHTQMNSGEEEDDDDDDDERVKTFVHSRHLVKILLFASKSSIY